MIEDRDRQAMTLDLSGAAWRKSGRSHANGECIEAAMVWRKSSRSSANGACVEVAAVWRKSSRSGANGECVEVAARDRAVAVRDSKNPAGPKLGVTPAAWSTFLGGIRAGALDPR